MSNLSTFFGWKVDASSEELPVIYPLAIAKKDFVETDVMYIYQKILTDVLERTHGLEDDLQSMLWDNCVQSDSSEGLVTMLAKAMSEKKALFLVYDPAILVVRRATTDEMTRIREDYKNKGESQVGVYISFEKYTKTDMVKLYSALEYYTVASLNKQSNLSASIQFKMKDMRGSTGLIDKAEVKAQAQTVARALANGNDVLVDAGDLIETATPQLDAIKASIEFLNEKRAFYLGLPASYISGEQTGGIGSTGEGDVKATERGLKGYFFSVIKPVLKAIFDKDVTYKSQDFRMIDKGFNALQTFSLVDEALISAEQKKLIIEKLFDIEAEDNKTTETPEEEIETVEVEDSDPV
jgi:hypothetical protein